MKNFVGFASNGEFSVGCTGQTVYLYDKQNCEIAKFKDIIYGYTPMISPNGKIFVVKSKEGRLAVYSLGTFSLIKKFRYSKLNASQDDGFCFSPDGKFFINIERHRTLLQTKLSIYNTDDFSLHKQLDFGEKTMLEYIEFDMETQSYYLLGFMRNAEGIIDHGFVAKLEDDRLSYITPISRNEHEFYRDYMGTKIMGFTHKMSPWTQTDFDLDELRSMNHTLAKLFKYYQKREK